MDDLIAFVSARLDEDEAAAGYATQPPWTNSAPGPFVGAEGRGIIAQTREGGDAEHIARHDPARVLREVAAKRAILAAHPHVKVEYPSGSANFGCEPCEHDSEYGMYGDGWCKTARALASVWSDHAGYRQEWKP
jgi:hypothetical protein